jgi:type I restriction enzyme S subunit
MLNIGQSVILELPVPVPAIGTQRLIVAELDAATGRIDTLVAQAESAITLLRERRAALISAAVTGQIDARDLSPEPVA